MCPHPRLAGWLFFSVMLAGSGVFAQTAHFSLTGNFSSPVDQHTDVTFTVGMDSPTTVRTWSWSGGTNAAGNTVPEGGIDSVLTLFDASNVLIAHNNDINDDPMISRDALLSPSGSGSSFLAPLSAGEYRARLSNHDNVIQNGAWSMDIVDESGRAIVQSITGSAMANLHTLALGASGGGTATLQIAADSSVLADELIHMQSGAVATLAGGTLSALRVVIDTGAQLNYVSGILGFGTLHLTGGEYLATNAAFPVSDNCIITIDSGTMSVGSLLVGRSGAGTVVHNGGTALASAFVVGSETAGSGTYLLSGGTVESMLTLVGHGAMGRFIQVAGHNSTDTLHIGGELGSGTYSLGNGHLLTMVETVIGAGGAGSFTHGFGTLAAANVTLARGADSTGIYLMGGGFLDVAGTTEVGAGGTATFVQTAGHQTAGSLAIASAGHGTYFFDGGTITVLNSTRVGVGEDTVASVFHTGGELQTGNLQLAPVEDAIANYHFSGGTLVINSSLAIGTAGNGTFTQSGGAMNSPMLQLGAESDGVGAYRFSGGTISVDAINAIAGSFHQTGGTLNAGTINTNGEPSRFVFVNGILFLTNSDLEIGPAGLFGSNVLLTSSRKVNVSGTTTVPIGQMLELDGGTFSTGTLLNAGVVAGTAAFVRVHNSANNTVTGRITLSDSMLHVAVNENRLVNAGTINFNNTSVIGEIESLSDSTITFSGTVALNGTLSSSGMISGAGAKFFAGGNSSVAVLDTTGSTRVEPDASLTADRIREPALSVGGVVSIRPDGSNQSVSRMQSLVIDGISGDWAGKVDLNDNALVIDYTTDSPVAIVRDQIISGYGAGSWNGTGITSTSASLNSTHALGFAEASDLHNSFPAEFMGQEIDSTSILVRYTLWGDADLDGNVNLTDFNRLAEGFGSSNALWSDGDFNFDGQVNLDDFNLLASHFGMSASGPGVGPGDWSALASVIPEPATLSIAVMASLFAMLRMRAR